MSDAKVYSIEVQGDFLTKQTYAKPAQALAELIWNSLDADATLVEVKQDTYGVGEQRIIVADNGTWFSHIYITDLLKHLGGSCKPQTG